MRRFFFITLGTLLFAAGSFAQVRINPVIVDEEGQMKDATKNYVTARISSTLSRFGILTGLNGDRFIMAVHCDAADKELIPGPAPKFVYRLDVTMAIGDGHEGVCFGSETFPTKGVGASEDQAYKNAMRNLLSAKGGNIGQMVSGVKERIIDYYNQHAASIIQKAKGLMKAADYDEAIYLLGAIPNECNAYAQANALIGQALKGRLDYNSAQVISQAEALWASAPTRENADAVMAILAEVSTASADYPKAQALKKKVETRYQQLDDRDHAAEREDARLAASVERSRINAAKAVSVAWAKAQPKTVYKFVGWW